MSINAQIIDQQVRKIAADCQSLFPVTLGRSNEETKRSAAFVTLCMARVLDIPPSEAAAYLTEGSGDFGIDGMYVGEVQDGDFPIYLFQGKYRQDLKPKGFPQDGVDKIIAALHVLVDPDAPINVNPQLLVRVEEARSLVRDGHMPYLQVYACNNGRHWERNAQDNIERAELGNQVLWHYINHDWLVEAQRRTEPVNDSFNLVGEAIVEDFNFRRVLLGKLPVMEIKRLFDQYGDRLLQRNIRRFLGIRRNRVNESISHSLRKDHLRENFYFYNNGITVTCSKFTHNALRRGNYSVRMETMQIINGGQTCKTIQRTLAEPDLADADFGNAYVLVRLYELSGEDRDLVNSITYATNSQNPVDLRDLKSNDERQQVLALAIEQLGYSYKRHREDTTSGASVITTAVAAESVLAVWRHRPHQANFRRAEHFGALYDDIFDTRLNGAQLVLAVLVFRAVETRRKSTAWNDGPHYLPYSSHFLAMLMGQELLGASGLSLDRIDHTTFEQVRRTLVDQEDRLYDAAREKLHKVLIDLFKNDPDAESLQRLSATFRRGDLFEKINALPGAEFHML